MFIVHGSADIKTSASTERVSTNAVGAVKTMCNITPFSVADCMPLSSLL